MNLVSYGKKFFNPTKLVEYVPGKKRVYLNRLTGTKTEYTLGDNFTLKDYTKKSNEYLLQNGCKEIGKAYVRGRIPEGVLASNLGGRYEKVLPLDTPMTFTPFEKVKTYLFGLIKGKPTKINTVNIADKYKTRGQEKPYTSCVSSWGSPWAKGFVHITLPSRAEGVCEESFMSAVSRTLEQKFYESKFNANVATILFGSPEKPTKLCKFIDKLVNKYCE